MNVITEDRAGTGMATSNSRSELVANIRNRAGTRRFGNASKSDGPEFSSRWGSLLIVSFARLLEKGVPSRARPRSK